MKVTNEINKNMFRQYDIRGIYGEDLNEDIAYTIGKAFGSILQDQGKKETLVAYDNRSSSPILFNALTQGLLDTGINVTTIKLAITPMYYFGMYHLNITSGIMITASHNPKEYNGFKMSWTGLYNICGEEIEFLRDYVLAQSFKTGKGKLTETNITNEYLDYITSSIKLGPNKPKVVVDCGNGTASIIVKELFDKIGIEYTPIFCDSDPDFPNHHPDPEHQENLKSLQETVIKTNSDLGIAFDGDGDRVGAIDELGNFIGADHIMIIVVRDILPKSKNKKVTFDVKCTKALEEEINKLNGTPIQFRTGDTYQRRKIYEDNVLFGGELSGHIYFNDKFYGHCDALYGALRIIEILSHTTKSISNLLEGINKYYSTGELKIKVTDENKFDIINKISEYAKSKNYKTVKIDGCKTIFDDGFALVRASNTGPDISMRFEAKTEERLKEIQDEFINELNKYV